MNQEIELLRLELDGLRAKNQALEDELKILRRFRKLVARAAEIVEAIPLVIPKLQTPKT